MARGGRRSGRPGTAYAQRSDLNGPPRPLPVTTAPGQTYGEAGQQAAAQTAVPMAPAGASDPTAQPAQPGGQPGFADVLAQAQAFQPPGVVPLRAPTTRPDEPLLTPPAPGPAPTNAVLSAVALLNSLGDEVSPAVKALRRVAQAGQANQAAP